MKLRQFLARGLVSVISKKALNLKKKIYVMKTNSLLSSFDPTFFMKNLIKEK